MIPSLKTIFVVAVIAVVAMIAVKKIAPLNNLVNGPAAS